MISLVGTYGKLLIIPENFQAGIINPRLLKITFNKEKINTVFFKYFFGSDSLQQTLTDNTHGGTMGIIILVIVKKIKIPVPPLELQQQFAAFVQQIDKSQFVSTTVLLILLIFFNKKCEKRKARIFIFCPRIYRFNLYLYFSRYIIW